MLETGGSDQDVRAAFKAQLRVRKPFSFTSPSILANRSRSKPCEGVEPMRFFYFA